MRAYKAKKKQLARKEIVASKRLCAVCVAGKRTHVLAFEVVCDFQQNTANIFTMAFTESLLSRLNKDDLIRIALDMQKWKLDTNSILIDIKYKLPEPRKSHEKLQADLGISKSVTEIISTQIVML